jgi:tetratricopeptide (TPR) repeat protein
MPEDRLAALGRLLDYLLHSSHAAQLLLHPNFPAPEPGVMRSGVTPEKLADYQRAMAWFAVERQVLQAAVGYAPEHGFHAQAWRLALTLQQFYRRQGYFYDWATTMRSALLATLDAGDLAGQAQVRRSLADACHLLGEDAEAIAELERARQLSSETNCPVEDAYLHSIFGAILANQGTYDEAVGHYQDAFALYQRADHRTGQAYALEAIGGCYGRQGRHDEATGVVHDAIMAYRDLGDVNGEGDCWLRLGDSHALLGENEQSIACYRRAVGLLRELGNRADEAGALISLGESALASGELGQAREAWETASIILNELGLPSALDVRRRLSRLRELSARRTPTLAVTAPT